MGVISLLSNIFKEKKEDQLNTVKASIENLNIGGVFSVDACHVYDISGKDFVVTSNWIDFASNELFGIPVLGVEDVSSGDAYFVSPVNVFSKKRYHFYKEISPDIVEALFFDKNWVFNDNEDQYIPPSDFRFIFDDNCRSTFVLSRLGSPKLDNINLTDWTSESYRFLNCIFTHINRKIDPLCASKNTQFQQYFLVDNNSRNTVCINVYSDGSTRVFVGYLAEQFVFKNIVS